MAKLTQAQRSMLFTAIRESGPRKYSIPRWKLAVTAPALRTLECLERAGLLVVQNFAEGSMPHVEVTEVGRALGQL